MKKLYLYQSLENVKKMTLIIILLNVLVLVYYFLVPSAAGKFLIVLTIGMILLFSLNFIPIIYGKSHFEKKAEQNVTQEVTFCKDVNFFPLFETEEFEIKKK